jgi:hypothetical protein
MASTIRLADAGLPETPPPGSARIFVEEYGGRLHLKMLRPDGSVEVFGTLNLPLEVENGGTGTTQNPGIGQILIGNGTRYNVGNIVAGRKISVNSTADSIEINAEVQDFSVTLETPPEFSVSRVDSLGATTLTLNKTTQSANRIYSGPTSGTDSEPTFRLLVESDIPDLDSGKIRRFEERVHESVASGLLDSAEISYNYDETTKKTSFSLKNSGVTAGTYGSGLQIPVITIDSKGRITSATTVDAKEAVEDYVGALIQSTNSIHAEYDDLNSKILLEIKPESIITTNISDSENFKAPTSQAIKQYIDDNDNAERISRISADLATQAAIAALQSQIGTDLQQQLNQVQQQLADYASQDATNLQQVVAQLTASQNALQAKVDRGIIIPRSDTFTITQQDLTNGYIVLTSNQILTSSVTAILERVVILEDIDFTVVSLPVSGSRLIFSESLPIDVGDVLRVSYLYAESLDVSLFARYDNYVIASQDIERGYLVLSNKNALFESISAFVDRTPLLQGFDFVISKNSDNDVIFTFIGDILPGQQLALEVGENIRVNYLYRT